MSSFNGTSKRLEVEPVSDSVNLDTHAFVVVVVGLFHGADDMSAGRWRGSCIAYLKSKGKSSSHTGPVERLRHSLCGRRVAYRAVHADRHISPRARFLFISLYCVHVGVSSNLIHKVAYKSV